MFIGHVGKTFGCLLCSLALSVIVAPALAQPIIVEEIVRNTPGGIARGLLARIDLQDPRVEVVVTGPATGLPSGADSNLVTVPSWRSTNNLDLAINANFFGTVTASTADIIGLTASDGTIVSPPRQFSPTSIADPAILISQAKVATIDYIAPGTTGIWDAVAGVGPSNTDTDPGTMLVIDGVNTGSGARVDPANRNPRTAVGVSRDGRTMWMLVMDGRLTGWSVGSTLAETADILLERGVWRAVNLDGGGSSSFAFRRPNGTILQNRPSDGSFRSVASHLGIRLSGSTVTDRWTRPIRGAWLRPPGGNSPSYPNTPDYVTLENTIATLAAAGIQDIFLEALFWGRDTGQNAVAAFPARFGTNDYLREAIRIAAKYSCRVHAWCETGYLDFGTSPSALLAANPSWVVKHVSVARNEATNPDPCTTPNTLTGDLANQRFVNLGNPGVRGVLTQYFSALASNYPGLAGIQADYHFFPLGNPPANLNNAAPFSYDAWTLANYRTSTGTLINPLPSATNCTGVINFSSTTFIVSANAHSNWINWNRQNVTDALVLLRAAVNDNATSTLFSAVSFGAWDGAVHVSKMIDLPGWGSQYGAEAVFIMAYQTAASNISNELSFAQTAWPNRRVVAGLANLTNTTRPSITDQLNAMNGRGIQDFCWFDAPTFISNSAGSQVTMRNELRAWIDNVAVPQVGDINDDGYIDARDRALFSSVFTGSPVPVTSGLTRYDLDASGTIDSNDQRLLTIQFRNFRFGEDGIVDARDRSALREAYVAYPTSGPPPGPTTLLNLYDLNGDFRVDYVDEQMLYDLYTNPIQFVTDANSNGSTTVEDLYIVLRNNTTDVNRDGLFDIRDAIELARQLRLQESSDLTAGQR